MKRTFHIFSLAIMVSLLVSAVGLPLIPAQAAGGWENVGPAGFSAGGVYYVSLTFNAGTPYVAFQDVQNGSKASVMKFDGTDWVYVGSAGFSAGQASFVSLAFDSGTPYVAYRDDANGRKASVMKFDALSGNWVNVGPAGFSTGEVYYAALAFDGGTPFVAFQDRSTPDYKLTVMKFDALSGNWVNVGPANFSPSVAYFISLAVDSGRPYVAFQDRSTLGNKASVMKFDTLAGNWVNVGPVGFSDDSANSISLVFDNGVPYMAYTGSSGSNVNKVSVMKFDALAGNWVNVGATNFSDPGAGGVSLAFDSGTPYVAFSDSLSNGYKARVMKFDGAYWVDVGAARFSPGMATYTSLAFDSGIPYVAYSDYTNGQKASVMKFTGGFSPTCFPLVLAHTGQGNNPTASPTNSAGCPGGQYVAGAAINLSSALPNSGWRIAGWTGTNNDSSILWTNTVAMPAGAHTVSVNYTQMEYTLTITSPHGTVTKSPDKATYHYGEVVQLTATADPDWLFVNWTGAAAGTVNTVSVTVQGNWSITANFVPKGTHTWYVATSGSDDNSCSTPASPCFNINGALGKASPGDTIKVAEGAYTKQLYDFLGWIVDIQTGVTILGGWNSTFTQQGAPSIIDGENIYSGIVNSAANVTLSGFIIQNAGNGQVGIQNGGDLTLDRMSVINNNGVGVDNGGVLVIQNTTISQNKGNGLVNNAGNVTVKNSTITNNQVNDLSTAYGGGIRTVYGTVTISNSIISGNSAPQAPDCYAYTINSSLVSNGYNIIGTNASCNITAKPGDKFNIDPLLLPLLSVGYQPISSGSPALDAGNDTACPSTDQRGVTRPQGSHCDIGAYEYQAKIERDTTGVFRPSNGLLYLKNQNTTGFADLALNYGLGGDYPVVGDWDGNGDATIGIYRNGYFYLRNSNTIGFADMVFAFGQLGDQPVAGDWNGDGIDTIGIYRPSNGQFLLRNNNSAGAAEMSFYLGNVGDVGIAGDWDGDGLDTTGVFRPSNGIIFLKNTNTTGFADVALNYGIPGDKPVTGDWDNDGIDTIGVYRNGQFMLRNSNTVGFADIVFGLGNPGDMPIAGNWDGLP